MQVSFLQETMKFAEVTEICKRKNVYNFRKI